MMCLVLLGGVWEPIVKWRTHMFTIFTPFFTLGPGSTTLYSTHGVRHGLISSTTLYNTLQSTALQQFYSLQPLHHPSAVTPPLQHARVRRSGALFGGVTLKMMFLLSFLVARAYARTPRKIHPRDFGFEPNYATFVIKI